MPKFTLPKQEEQSILKTVRIKMTLYKRVEKISEMTGISINRIITTGVEYALDNIDEEELAKKKKRKPKKATNYTKVDN